MRSAFHPARALLLCAFAACSSGHHNLDRHHWRLVRRNELEQWVPTSSTDAFINNAGEAQILSSGGTAQSLTLGLNSGDSGTVSVDGTNGGSLTVPPECDDYFPGDISVGYQGTGTLIITNGGTVSSGFGYIGRLVSLSAASNGSVTVSGANSTWTIGNPCGANSRLFVSGTGTSAGGTGLLTVTNGGTVVVNNHGNSFSVKVGASGTLTGNGTIINNANGSASRFTAVQGTLAPSGALTIVSDLGMITTTTTVCHVTPQAADNVQVLSGVASGIAQLDGRLSVTITGTFTPGTQYTLLHADGGLDPNHNRFQSVSINYPPVPTYTPVITYDANNVYLYLMPN
jgi:hypothetical protein